MNPPVLFIPGLACGEGQWRREAEFFAATRETAVFELPRRSGLSVEGHLQALDAKLRSLRWENSILIGHSLGGNLTAAFARENPERVEATVLVDPTGDLRAASFEQVAEDGYRDFVRGWFEDLLGSASAETRDRVLSDLLEVSSEVFYSTFEAYMDYDFSKILDSRLDRTLCVDGEGPKGAFSFQRLYPNLARRSLPDVGHWLHLDDPSAFRGAVKGFFSL